MSWSINIVGSRAAVKAALATCDSFPQELKDLVANIADAPSATGAIQVVSYGHTDATYGGTVGKFEVAQVTLATEPEPVAAPDPGAPAAGSG